MEALPLLVVTGCFYGVLVSGDSAIYSTAITELAEPDRLGSAQAFQAFLGFGATILAPVAASLLLDLGLGGELLSLWPAWSGLFWRCLWYP